MGEAAPASGEILRTGGILLTGGVCGRGGRALCIGEAAPASGQIKSTGDGCGEAAPAILHDATFRHAHPHLVPVSPPHLPLPPWPCPLGMPMRSRPAQPLLLRYLGGSTATRCIRIVAREEYTKPLVDTFMWLDGSGEGTISAAEVREGLVKSGHDEQVIPTDLEPRLG